MSGQVREALCELELPYRRVACGKGSKRRPLLQQTAGSTQVPPLFTNTMYSKH